MTGTATFWTNSHKAPNTLARNALAVPALPLLASATAYAMSDLTPDIYPV